MEVPKRMISRKGPEWRPTHDEMHRGLMFSGPESILTRIVASPNIFRQVVELNTSREEKEWCLTRINVHRGPTLSETELNRMHIDTTLDFSHNEMAVNVQNLEYTQTESNLSRKVRELNITRDVMEFCCS